MDKNKYNVIVVGSDHYNTLWIVRSLGMGGFNVTIVIINPDSNKSFVSKSKYCNTAYIVKDSNEMIHKLCELSCDYKVPVFTNADAVAVTLDESYDILSQKYILHHCNLQQGGIKYWMDKSKMLALAASVGLNTPFTLSVDLSNDLLDYETIPYPCLIKPEISAEASKQSFRVCYSKDQLKSAVNEVKFDCTL